MTRSLLTFLFGNTIRNVPRKMIWQFFVQTRGEQRWPSVRRRGYHAPLVHSPSLKYVLVTLGLSRPVVKGSSYHARFVQLVPSRTDIVPRRVLCFAL